MKAKHFGAACNAYSSMYRQNYAYYSYVPPAAWKRSKRSTILEGWNLVSLPMLSSLSKARVSPRTSTCTSQPTHGLSSRLDALRMVTIQIQSAVIHGHTFPDDTMSSFMLVATKI